MIVIINGHKFQVSDSLYYSETDDDMQFSLYDFENDPEPACIMSAGLIKKLCTPVVPCYADRYAEKMGKAIKDAYDSLVIHDVLRLYVHNEKYIHYLIGQTLLEDLWQRKGPWFLAYAKSASSVDDAYKLYAGRSGFELITSIQNDVPACANGAIILLQDQYLQAAIEKLKERHDHMVSIPGTYQCLDNYFHSEWKDPAIIVPEVGECQAHHTRHCKWCMEMGDDARHRGNHWNNDGIVYDDDAHTTSHSHYGRIQGECGL